MVLKVTRLRRRGLTRRCAPLVELLLAEPLLDPLPEPFPEPLLELTLDPSGAAFAPFCETSGEPFEAPLAAPFEFPFAAPLELPILEKQAGSPQGASPLGR